MTALLVFLTPIALINSVPTLPSGIAGVAASLGAEKPFLTASAFSIAAGLTVVGLPSALLYFAAIDQILRADLRAPGIVNAVLFYNVVYLSPLMLIVLSRRLFGARADPLFGAVARFLERWGKRLMFFGLLGLGAVLVADAIGWFIGFPLLPSPIR